MGFIGQDHGADNRLAAVGDGDVLNDHALLTALAPFAIASDCSLNWRINRVARKGPHVGQGASLAIENALIVAKCL